MKTILLLTATLAAVTATYLASSSAAANTFADIGKKDNGGPDDIYAAQQTLKTPEGEDVGTVNGYGVNLHPPYVFFHWTATLPSGTLTLESAVNLRTNPVVYSIEGGTGHYAGASGTVTLTDDGSKGTLATIRYRL
jgi:hypothetical protein